MEEIASRRKGEGGRGKKTAKPLGFSKITGQKLKAPYGKGLCINESIVLPQSAYEVPFLLYATRYNEPP